MSLINRKKAHKPFLTSRQVAERVGGISAKSVSNRTGVTAGLTRFPLGVNGGPPYGYDQDQVEALCQRIREAAEKEMRARERAFEPHRRALRAVGG